jgi:very-short-patch-repair endonuclease
MAVLNRYSRLSADFVICSRDCAPLAVAELDDASHQRSASRVRDAKKDAVLAAAGIRLFRWHVRSMPDVVRIRQEFSQPVGGASQHSEGVQDVGGAGV